MQALLKNITFTDNYNLAVTPLAFSGRVLQKLVTLYPQHGDRTLTK